MSYDIDLGGTDLHVNSISVGAATPGAAGTNITTSLTDTTINGTNVNVGASGTAGTLKVFPATASKGDLKITISNQTGNTEVGINAAAMGQATVVTLPDPGGATAKFLLDTATVPATFAAGTTSTAPITFTAGTNLTTATAGAIEFDGNALYSTNHANSRQVVDAEQYIIQAADSTADNAGGLDSNTAAAVFTTGSGAVTLVSGKTYIFEGQYLLTNTGTTSHTWGTAFGGGATFNAAGTAYSGAGSSSGTASTGVANGGQGFRVGATLSTALTALTQASTSATEQVTVMVQGTLSCSGNGTFIPQMIASARPGASGTPGVVHKAGSFFRIWEVPTLGSVGNWS